MGILAVPVKINGVVCRNCYDVDWARRAEADDAKKRAADNAQKARDARGDISLDNRSETTLDGSLKTAAASASAPVAPPPTDTPGQSVNIFA